MRTTLRRMGSVLMFLAAVLTYVFGVLLWLALALPFCIAVAGLLLLPLQLAGALLL